MAGESLTEQIVKAVAQGILGQETALATPRTAERPKLGYSQEEADYTDKGDDNQCHGCSHFASEIYGSQDPNNGGAACRIVEGKIMPGGWCQYFTAGQPMEESGDEPEPDDDESD